MKLILKLEGHPVAGESFVVELDLTPGVLEQPFSGFMKSALTPMAHCVFDRLHPLPTGIKDDQRLVAAHLDHIRRWHG